MAEKLILASASARRSKILTALGVDFEVMKPEVEEVLHATDAVRTARENAARKHAWCRRLHPHRYILAADTICEFRGRCITKAETPEQALDFLRMFSGNTHTVYTGVALSRPHAMPDILLAGSTVHFRPLSEPEILAYFKAVNPMDRAGAYDIDELGESLVDSFTGSRTNIMGLPSEAVSEWFHREGLL